MMVIRSLKFKINISRKKETHCQGSYGVGGEDSYSENLYLYIRTASFLTELPVTGLNIFFNFDDFGNCIGFYSAKAKFNEFFKNLLFETKRVMDISKLRLINLKCIPCGCYLLSYTQTNRISPESSFNVQKRRVQMD